MKFNFTVRRIPEVDITVRRGAMRLEPLEGGPKLTLPLEGGHAT